VQISKKRRTSPDKADKRRGGSGGGQQGVYVLPLSAARMPARGNFTERKNR
jgi:hypothetical protein